LLEDLDVARSIKRGGEVGRPYRQKGFDGDDLQITCPSCRIGNLSSANLNGRGPSDEGESSLRTARSTGQNSHAQSFQGPGPSPAYTLSGNKKSD